MKNTGILFLLLILLIGGIAGMHAQTAVPSQALSGKPMKVDKAQFLKYIYNYEKNPDAWIYEGNIPCIIDFYADWCGPCRKLSPILERVAKKYKGKLVVYKVDTESQRELASYFQVRSIPMIVFVPVKGTPQAVIGLVPKGNLEQIIADVLKIPSVNSTDI